MYLSRKIELKPNQRQVVLFRQHCGVARHAWNWGLQQCLDVIERRKHQKNLGHSLEKFPTAIDLHKKLVAEVKPMAAWYYASSKCSPQQAIRDLIDAFKRRLKNGFGWPKYRRKGRKSSFYLDSASRNIVTTYKKIKLPFIGWVRSKEKFPPGNVFKNVVVSERAGRWFVVIKYRVDECLDNGLTSVIGIDLGIKTLATCSNGTSYLHNSGVIGHLERRLAKLQRKLARQQATSGRSRKTKEKISCLRYRITNIRNDTIHKLTHHVAKNHGVIVIEDLCIRGMLRNKRFSKFVSKQCWGEIRKQLTYKCKLFGSKLVVANRWFPSSKTCSKCENVKTSLSLTERVYVCQCGHVLDRDLNAAYNLENYGRKFYGYSAMESAYSG